MFVLFNLIIPVNLNNYVVTLLMILFVGGGKGDWG